MLPQSLLVDAVRGLGYAFKTETRSRRVYKQQGGTNRVLLPKTKLISEDNFRSILGAAGASSEAVDSLIASCRQDDES